MLCLLGNENRGEEFLFEFKVFVENNLSLSKTLSVTLNCGFCVVRSEA